MTAFWVLTACRIISSFRYFGGIVSPFRGWLNPILVDMTDWKEEIDWLYWRLQGMRLINLPTQSILRPSHFSSHPESRGSCVPLKQQEQTFYPTWCNNPEDYHLSYTNCESLITYMYVIIYSSLEIITFFRWHAQLSERLSVYPYEHDNFGRFLWMFGHPWVKLQFRDITQDCSEAEA